MITAKFLEQRLHRQIPVSQFMQFEVVRLAEDIELERDLAPNHNHLLGTAFGGSLSALMILAAYCQLFRLINENGHVVLKSTSMQFLIPVEVVLADGRIAATLTGEFVAVENS